MRFEKNVEDEYTVVKLLEDKLDSRISASLKSEFIMLSTNGVKNIIFNMDQVKYTDSSGLSAILTANRLCRDSNGTLILTNLTPHAEKLIKISHLETVLYILPTEEEAREAIHMLELEKKIQEGSDTE